MNGTGTCALKTSTTLDKVMDFFGHPTPDTFPTLRRMQREAPIILRIDDIAFKDKKDGTIRIKKREPSTLESQERIVRNKVREYQRTGGLSLAELSRQANAPDKLATRR